MRFVSVSISLSLSCLLACTTTPKTNTVPDGGVQGVDATPQAGGQTPPMGATAVEAWLATGAYKQWACEPMAHAGRAPSPHGLNRICSNMVIAQDAAGSTPWPAGAAAVKELFSSATDTTPTGYSVYLKTAADSAAGANWYWYERIDASVIADGRGNGGPARSICVGCHSAAGKDPAHTPSPGARDQVYTAVH